MFAITFAWRYYQRQRRENAVLRSPFRQPEIERSKRTGKGFFKFSFPKPMGMLPLIYLCWICYAFVLVVKIYLIFGINVPEKMIAVRSCKPFNYKPDQLLLTGQKRAWK